MRQDTSYPLTERAPDAIVAWRDSNPVTVQQLINDASWLARRLPSRRFVLNLHTDRYRYLVTFCAAVIAGQCTLMPPNRQPGMLEQLRKDYPDSHTLDENDAPIVAVPADVPAPDIPASQLCAIAFTSGSTGTPQPNYKYWETCRAGSLSNRKLMLASGRTLNVVATVPAQHMWGMETAVLLPLFADVAISHRVPFFPQDIVAALAALPAPRALVSAPVHLEAFLKAGVQPVPVEIVFTATAPLSQSLATDLEQRCNGRVIEIFGCSESGILAVRRTASETLWTLARAFRIELRESGFDIVAGHLPETVTLPDIVELHEGHRFRWIGRQQDMINIAGKRGSLADMNQRLRAIDGVADGVVFLPPDRDDRLAALVVAPDLKVSAILQALKPQVEPLFLPRPIYRVAELPRQETGKLPLAAVHELYEQTRKQLRS